MQVKHCPRCKQEKRHNAFAKNSFKKDGLQSWCRECRKEIDRAYYRSHTKEMIKAIQLAKRNRRDQTYQYIHKYLLSHPCLDCGETDPIVLDFDHRKDKYLAVSDLIRRGRSWINVLREIEKCEVRCANCHRKKTAKQLKWTRSLWASS